jgi:hypothetical protein
MNNWLQSFAYRIHISPWIFMIAGVSSNYNNIINDKFSINKSGGGKPVSHCEQSDERETSNVKRECLQHSQ